MNTIIIKKPTTLSEVRDELTAMYVQVMKDPKSCPQVKEGTNALGKVINACKTNLEYCKIAKAQPNKDWSKFMSE